MKGDGECRLLKHQSCHVEYQISVRRQTEERLRCTGKQYISLWLVWHFTQLCFTPTVLRSAGVSASVTCSRRKWVVFIVLPRRYFSQKNMAAKGVVRDNCRKKTFIILFLIWKGGLEGLALSLAIDIDWLSFENTLLDLVRFAVGCTKETISKA